MAKIKKLIQFIPENAAIIISDVINKTPINC